MEQGTKSKGRKTHVFGLTIPGQFQRCQWIAPPPYCWPVFAETLQPLFSIGFLIFGLCCLLLINSAGHCASAFFGVKMCMIVFKLIG